MIWRFLIGGVVICFLFGRRLEFLITGIFLGYLTYGIYQEKAMRSNGKNTRDARRRPAPTTNPHAAAYRTLGVAPSVSNATLKARYRALAKRFHPDALRAAGKSEDAIRRANEQMSRINAAWSEVRAARGI